MWYNLTNEVGRVAYAMELCGLYEKCDEIYDYFLESPGVKSDGDFSTGEGALEWANDMRHDMGYSHEGTHSSSGMLIYAMMYRYFMTKDADWVEERLDRLFEAVDWMLDEATYYMDHVSNNENLLCYGLLPPAMMGDYALPSCDWHWYFSDNAYMLQALNAFAAVLTDMGHSEAECYTKQAEIFAENTNNHNVFMIAGKVDSVKDTVVAGAAVRVYKGLRSVMASTVDTSESGLLRCAEKPAEALGEGTAAMDIVLKERLFGDIHPVKIAPNSCNNEAIL